MSEQFQIRVEKPADYPAITRVHDLAFGRTDEGLLVEKIRNSDTFLPELAFVATIGSEIIGHVLFSRVYIDAHSGPKPVLALAPLAVHPDFQRQGVGDKLSRTGIEKARQLGYDGIIVLGQPSYYPRFGFAAATELGIESPFPLNDPAAFMALELRDGALDDCSGTVVYPEFFTDPD